MVAPQPDSRKPHVEHVGDAWIVFLFIEKDDPIHSVVLGHLLNLPVISRDEHHSPFHLGDRRQDDREKLHIEWILVRLHVTDDANGSGTLPCQVSGDSVGSVPQFLDGLQDTNSRGRSNILITSIENK